MGSLDGRVALVSGAARGQGRSHARHLARRGAAVIGFDICGPIADSLIDPATEDDLRETQRLVEDDDGRISTFVADARDFDGVAEVVARGAAEYGPVDIVVASAGILGRPGKSWTIVESRFRDVLDVNVIGVWNTVRAVVVPLLDQGLPGAAVITGSGASTKGVPNLAPYVASKHALVGLVHTMARELGPHRIRVNAVLPGNVDTTMFHNDAVRSMFLPDLPGFDEAEFLRRAAAGSPMGLPYVGVDAVSEAVCYLVSDAAATVTGALLPVDSGSGIP